MSEEQVHEYDEIAIVSMLLSDNERLKKAESFLLPEDFANEGCSVLLRSLYTFEAKYGRLPTVAELRDSLILPRHAPVEEIHRQLAEGESHLKEIPKEWRGCGEMCSRKTNCPCWWEIPMSENPISP